MVWVHSLAHSSRTKAQQGLLPLLQAPAALHSGTWLPNQPPLPSSSPVPSGVPCSAAIITFQS